MVPLLDGAGRADPVLAWLLEPTNPSARYLTLTRLLGRSGDDPEVLASRAAISQVGPARDILLAQYPQGYWMHPGIGYSPRYRATLWQILFLAQLGMARSDSLDRAVDHLFDANQRQDGAFRASKERGDTPACLNGALLWALETLGFGDAEPVQRAWSWLAQTVEAGGLGATYPDGEACPSAAVKVLWATSAVPAGRRRPAVRFLSQTAAELLLDDPLDPFGAGPGVSPTESRDWHRLTFPLAHSADLLQWLEVLVAVGCGGDPRLDAARRWVEKKQLADGTWPLERTPGRQWADYGAVGEPNKWVTLRALAVSGRGPGGKDADDRSTISR